MYMYNIYIIYMFLYIYIHIYIYTHIYIYMEQFGKIFSGPLFVAGNRYPSVTGM